MACTIPCVYDLDVPVQTMTCAALHSQFLVSSILDCYFGHALVFPCCCTSEPGLICQKAKTPLLGKLS